MKPIHRTLRSAFVLCLSLFSASPASAAPVITGVSGIVSDGQSMIVTGSGFGTHPDYGGSQPWLNKAYNDFDAGVLEAGNLSLSASVYLPNWRLVSTDNRTNSSMYAGKYYNIEELGALSTDMSGSLNEVYVSFWFKVLPNTQSGKFLRVYGDNGNIYLSTGDGDYFVRAYGENGTAPTQWDSPDQFVPNTWHRLEFYLSVSPAVAIAVLDNKQQWSVPGFVASSFGLSGHTVDIGNMIDGPERGGGIAGEYGYDDIYVDHSRARIELCTGSSSATKGACEIQLPISWSTSSATALVNQGAFSSGTAYLYVIDSTGAVNMTGYPVMIGATDTTPPAAPTGLIVN